MSKNKMSKVYNIILEFYENWIEENLFNLHKIYYYDHIYLYSEYGTKLSEKHPSPDLLFYSVKKLQNSYNKMSKNKITCHKMSKKIMS